MQKNIYYTENQTIKKNNPEFKFYKQGIVKKKKDFEKNIRGSL